MLALDAIAQSLPSPVAEFKFNGDYTDSTGNLANATAFGTYFTTNRFGNLNSAVGFNGNQYARISGLGSLLSGADNISIAGWYWIESGKSSPFYYGSGFMTTAGGVGVAPALSFIVSGDANNIIGGQLGRWQDSFTTTVFPMGNWAQIVAVLAKDQTPAIYLNGTALNWNNAPAIFSNAISFTSDYGIGNNLTDNSPYFSTYSKGGISDLKFYTTALTASEVQILYDAEVIPEPSTYTLLLLSGAGSLWALRRRKS